MARSVGWLASLAALGSVHGYFLMGMNNVLTTERIDPIVNYNAVAGHVHTVFGGSNFRVNTDSTEALRQSECTSTPIKEDKSLYWVPTLYFQWKNGSFTSVNGGAVVYYLYPDKAGSVTAFPDNFRMLSGDPLLRTYDANSHAQQAITFLCLDFNGKTTTHNELPKKKCPSGVRAQVNFPMCWDGKNVDSADHRSHVSFPSDGADKGSCNDPNYPVTLPRVFMEMYLSTPDFADKWDQAMRPDQPFVYSHGDPTGYGYHGDFFNGWASGVLQKVVDNCSCDPNGSLDCCAAKGIFTLDKTSKCQLTRGIDEVVTGTLPKLPGNNPVQEEGTKAQPMKDPNPPRFIQPVYVYRGDKPDKVGQPVGDAPTPPTNDGNDGNGDNGNTGNGNGGVSTPTTGTPVSPPTTGTPVSPPVNGTPVSPPVNGTPVSPPTTGTPASPPVNGTPASPPVNGTPVSPPTTGTTISPPFNGTPVSPPVTGTPGSGNGSCKSRKSKRGSKHLHAKRRHEFF